MKKLPWGAVSSSLWRSKSFRPLSDSARNFYIYAHCSPHRNSIGVYQLPVMFMADDLGRDVEDVKSSIEACCHAGLIGYDQNEELLWVRNWELLNAPDSPQQVIGRVSDFDLTPEPEHVFVRAAFLLFSSDFAQRALGRLGGKAWKQGEHLMNATALVAERLATWVCDVDVAPPIFALSGVSPRDRGIKSLLNLECDRVWEGHEIPNAYGNGIPYRSKDKDKDKDKDNGATPLPSPRATPDDVKADIQLLIVKAGSK
ncbi:hypothetical protein [Celeribacter sp.]|uniref:hypothetical protein n=1 Tax=Celeribacter sp. TaxID=1890673 RepID=UPI003A94B977